MHAYHRPRTRVSHNQIRASVAAHLQPHHLDATIIGWYTRGGRNNCSQQLPADNTACALSTALTVSMHMSNKLLDTVAHSIEAIARRHDTKTPAPSCRVACSARAVNSSQVESYHTAGLHVHSHCERVKALFLEIHHVNHIWSSTLWRSTRSTAPPMVSH